ncbi:hypothetical protein RB195_023716 [Necator americanus]|uniref:Reverse transcriptase domain-containing protein n=1 Tax=Necator americanus TaxID=51031 RepID=A0ABR1EMJ1_NECAM
MYKNEKSMTREDKENSQGKGALRTDGVTFVRLLDDIYQQTTAAVLTTAECTTTFEVVTERHHEYANDVVILAESSAILQHVVGLVSKLAAAYGLLIRLDKCKEMWISSKPRTGTRMDGEPIELVDEFCYLGCMLKNNDSYEKDIQQGCDKATPAFNSLTKCL